MITLNPRADARDREIAASDSGNREAAVKAIDAAGRGYTEGWELIRVLQDYVQRCSEVDDPEDLAHVDQWLVKRIEDAEEDELFLMIGEELRELIAIKGET